MSPTILRPADLHRTSNPEPTPRAPSSDLIEPTTAYLAEAV